MRVPSRFHSHRDELDVTMTPMIDVVFLLLIFFVWTASFRIAEQVLPTAVSEIRGAEPVSAATPPPPEADFPDLIIRVQWIDGAPHWRLNDQPIDELARLQAQLTRVFLINEQAPVVIFPDPATPLGHVIDVYDVSRLAGFSEVQFAVATSGG